MAKSALSYLLKSPRSHNFYFRIRVPFSLRGVVIKKEFRYSLRTSDELEAKYRSMHLARGMKNLFKCLEKGDKLKEITREEIHKMINDNLKKMLDEAENDRVLALKPLNEDQHTDQLDALVFLEIDARTDLAYNDYSRVSSDVDDLLKENGIHEIDKQSESYKSLCRELLKTWVKYYEIEQKRMVGDYEEEKKILHSEQITPIQSESPSGVTLSQVISEYAEEQKRSGVWTDKTEGEVLSSISLLKEVLGDLPVSDINSAMMSQFKKTLLSLPPNLKKKPEYREKSIKEILAMDISKPMNLTTINKQLARASALFKWAVKNGYMDKNPAEGLQLTLKKREDEYRDIFNDHDLKQLFHSKEYLEDKHKHSYCFWLPLIALFTGMRLDEICQLQLEDIYQSEDGVYVFNVNDKDGRKLKNKSSRRIVPLHDFLINDLNLPSYVKKLETAGEIRLFPDLKKSRDGYGQAASRWFARYKESCGIGTSQAKKDFHSFRHTLADNLKQATVEPTLLMELLGHEVGSITLGRYGKRYNARLLKEKVVDQLKYGVDFEHLKKSRFVVGLS